MNNLKQRPCELYKSSVSIRYHRYVFDKCNRNVKTGGKPECSRFCLEKFDFRDFMLLVFKIKRIASMQ